MNVQKEEVTSQVIQLAGAKVQVSEFWCSLFLCKSKEEFKMGEINYSALL